MPNPAQTQKMIDEALAASPIVSTPSITGGTITGATFSGATKFTKGTSTIALGTNSGTAAVLPAGALVCPTTAADDTVGVRVHADDKVSGVTKFIGNGVSNKILKVYAPTGGTINGASADAAYSGASGKGVIITCLDADANTWLAWG